jgi:hypothetical protein
VRRSESCGKGSVRRFDFAVWARRIRDREQSRCRACRSLTRPEGLERLPLSCSRARASTCGDDCIGTAPTQTCEAGLSSREATEIKVTASTRAEFLIHA